MGGSSEIPRNQNYNPRAAQMSTANIAPAYNPRAAQMSAVNVAPAYNPREAQMNAYNPRPDVNMLLDVALTAIAPKIPTAIVAPAFEMPKFDFDFKMPSMNLDFGIQPIMPAPIPYTAPPINIIPLVNSSVVPNANAFVVPTITNNFETLTQDVDVAVKPKQVYIPRPIKPTVPAPAPSFWHSKEIVVIKNAMGGKNSIQGAHIEVNGDARAVTDANGKAILGEIDHDDDITIASTGYRTATYTGQTLPDLVILVPETKEIAPNNTGQKNPQQKTNALVWAIAAGVAAFGIYKYSQKGSKVVKAKI